MSGARSRNKGARGEREVKAIAVEHGYPNARRYMAGDGFQPGDLDGGPAGWVIEVKWWDNVTAACREGLRQAIDEAATAGRRWPMVAVRLEGGPTRWVALVRPVDWLDHPDLKRVAVTRMHDPGTLPARLALVVHRRGAHDIGHLIAMPLDEWFDAVRTDACTTTA